MAAAVMKVDKSNVIAGGPKVSGGFLVAPYGIDIPTGIDADLSGFTSVGFVNEEGLNRSENKSSDLAKDWKGTAIKVLNLGAEVTVKITLSEYLNATAQGAIYGFDNVTETGGVLTIKGKTAEPSPRLTAVALLMDADGAEGLVVFPDFQVTELGDTSFRNSEVAVRDITAAILADEDNTFFYEYWQKATTNP